MGQSQSMDDMAANHRSFHAAGGIGPGESEFAGAEEALPRRRASYSGGDDLSNSHLAQQLQLQRSRSQSHSLIPRVATLRGSSPSSNALNNNNPNNDDSRAAHFLVTVNRLRNAGARVLTRRRPSLSAATGDAQAQAQAQAQESTQGQHAPAGPSTSNFSEHHINSGRDCRASEITVIRSSSSSSVQHVLQSQSQTSEHEEAVAARAAPQAGEVHGISNFEDDFPLGNNNVVVFVENLSGQQQQQQQQQLDENSSSTVSDIADDEDIADQLQLLEDVDDEGTERQHERQTATEQRNNNDDYIVSAVPEFVIDYPDFYPPISRNYEWMGRSIETLLLGHGRRAPILQMLDETDVESNDYDFYALRRRSTASTFGAVRRRSTAGSMGSFPGGRRGSLSLSGNLQGGTLASYYARRPRAQQHSPANEVAVDRPVVQRRGSTAFGPATRRHNSVHSHGSGDPNGDNKATTSVGGGGPNVLFHVLARESTGLSYLPRELPSTQKLRKIGGHRLFQKLDQPAAGLATEVSFLAAAIETGDWAETHAIVSRLVVRLIGDPGQQHRSSSYSNYAVDDPNLPPQAHRFYAGGGRLGLERDAFVQAGGVTVLLRMFREKSFVGQEVAYSYDARDLGEGLVASRLAGCWNEALAALRELVYYMPGIVEEGSILDQGDFLPFLFSMLSHDSCFDGAAALIEEILSILSQTQAQAGTTVDPTAVEDALPAPRSPPARTFFLGDIPDLYRLWRGFNCRQLAHFCRILALLVFEPEDRQLLERPAVLRSLELLQLRRRRSARRDSTVDMNQAIVLGDPELLKRLLRLLTVMNYAPPLRRFAPYHVLSHFPFVADTLVMLGLGELERWDELERLDALARQLLVNEYSHDTSEEVLVQNQHDGNILADDDDADGDFSDGNSQDDGDNEDDNGAYATTLCDLCGVADMLEGLSSTLNDQTSQPPSQISHIIHVISAAQQAGVVVGRTRNGRSQRRRMNNRVSLNNRRRRNRRAGETNSDNIGSPSNNNSPTLGSLASVAGILTDQLLVRRLYQGSGQGIPDELGGNDLDDDENEHLIRTPEDAANALQFNAMLLGPYQVEVLFVLCTLLGGRRKLDAQDTLNQLGVVPVLDEMFQRLPWYRPERSHRNGANEDNDRADRAQDSLNIDNLDSSESGNSLPNGIHGPGCECTPESALCVQYLRMIHNFCDRDCDNYEGRRLMLSEDEKRHIFSQDRCEWQSSTSLAQQQRRQPGLLSKLTQAFIRESDESPYRFWLASCIESFLRGSSAREQLYVAQLGLLNHLVEEISSEKLHCAGSLQTSFDLLGELGKGNVEVVELLVNDLDEESFRKLMSVAAANLVDSNVFIRSLLLSLERLSARNGLLPLYLNAPTSSLTPRRWLSSSGYNSRSYLSHSWWDAQAIGLDNVLSSSSSSEDGHSSNVESFNARPSDWFPSRNLVTISAAGVPEIALIPSGLTESVGHYGWVFTPVGETLSAKAFLPNTVERLSWFLAANQARLLRDLLGVVDLRNINHENICCLNTAVVIAIFAHRRKQLALLLNELRRMNEEEKESKRRAGVAAAAVVELNRDVVDRAFAQALRYVEEFSTIRRESYPYARRVSLANSVAAFSGGAPQIGDRSDAMRNFREVLWFWTEYYTHRGRDRLSLEFSSHIRFQEWSHVVSLLGADDGSSTALVRSPVRLPRSPYQRAARVSPIRGE